MSLRLPFAFAALLYLASVPALAQTEQPDYSAPAHVAAVEGTPLLERNGAAEPALENLPLLQGDRLRTDGGRLEIILPDGSILDIDRHSTVDLLDGGLLRLPAGRILFVVARPGSGEARRDYQVDSPSGSVRFSGAGEYRVSTQLSAGAPFLEVSVVRGEAVVDAEGRSVALRAGERVQVSQGQGITATGTFNSAATDAFLEWTESQRGERVGQESTAYLPPDLQVYGGTFDRDGSWENSGDYGWVWYPRVAADWRPYYDGGWYPYGWGWTWVGGGRWAWPTHHYGRWGYAARGWFWIPGTHWGPAWVSWGMGGNYVSWCPLGYRDGPVFGLSIGASVGGFNAWRGWTVVPHSAFGRGYRVPSHAVRGEALRTVERVDFAVRRSGPPVSGVSAAQRYGGGRTGPYDGARAVAGQRAGSNPGWAESVRPVPSGAGNSGVRTWSTGASAVERTPAYDTRPFSSPPAVSGYPERYRSSGSTSSGVPLGAAVPRSAPSRPSESRSPYYYLGPSRQGEVPSPSTTREQQPEAGRSAEPSSPRYRSYPGTVASSPSPWTGGSSPSSEGRDRWALPPDSPSTPTRSYSNGSSPSSGGRDRWALPSGSPSTPTRSYSNPDRAAQPRGGASSSPAAGSPASQAPAPSGWHRGGAASGGPGGGSSAGGRPSGGGGLPAGGARPGAGGGGGRTSGGGARGGRGR